MNIRILGAHNCESESTRFVSILIDDVIALDAGGLTSSLSLSAQQKLLALLLTHGHYDHIRDFPALAMNLFLANNSIDLYAPQPVYDMVRTHLSEGDIYPNFFNRPVDNPTVRFYLVEPGKTFSFKGYTVLPVSVNHNLPTVGYQIATGDKSVFFTGDTGSGLSECWKQISPQLLIIEVTAPNSFQTQMEKAGHLTPNLLKQELLDFRRLKGYFPQVVAVHMTPQYEKDIRNELERLGRDMDCYIQVAYEGMTLTL